MKPTKKEIDKFIDTINRAFNFEAEHRYQKGFGAFTEFELPITEVSKVTEWITRENIMKRLWIWIKNKFKKPVKEPDLQWTAPEEPVKPPIPPVVVEGKIFITRDHLIEIFKHADLADIYKYVDPLNTMFEQYNINSFYRVCHCLAQIGKESSHLRYTTELGNKAYFIKYNGRLGNSWKPWLAEGYKYRGRGLIQLTGKSHYQKYSAFLKSRGYPTSLVSNPNKLSALPFSVDVVGYYWTVRRDINPLCDLGDDGIRNVTLAVNGGTNGLDDRLKLYLKAKEVLNGHLE